ncbi:MAG: dihydrodipicolinate synthase family protein [Phycisphaerae bacterium]|nr:dihydrodipicolinate synthase family protein [Phycisphaerae bacterium]
MTGPTRKKLSGIFTPNMVPLDENDRINEPELRRYTEWLIANGISGLYPNGSTGEFTRFSFEERKEIVRIMSEQAGGRVQILAGAAEANVRTTIQACEYYASLGVDAVAIVSPFYYKISDESVYAYFDEIARNTPVDITLYNIPQFANPISLDCIKRLSEHPRIIGLKDSSRDLPFFLNLMNEISPLRPDFVFLLGCEEMLVPSLVMGGDGGTIATSGIVPEVIMRMYHLTKQGQLTEAVEIQYKVLQLIKSLIFGTDFPEGCRAGLEIRGFRMGRGRMPLSPSQRCDRQSLRTHLQCLISEHGLVEEPPGGCPTRQPARLEVDRVEIERIVSSVLSRLRQQGAV